MEHLGLLPFAHKPIDTFSGGMKRRVNLIASILHNPKVLFLDEPTVGVDTAHSYIPAKLNTINHLTYWDFSGKLDFAEIRNEFYR